MAKKKKDQDSFWWLFLLLFFLVFIGFWLIKWLNSQKKTVAIAPIDDIKPTLAPMISGGGGGGGSPTIIADFDANDFDSSDFDTGFSTS